MHCTRLVAALLALGSAGPAAALFQPPPVEVDVVGDALVQVQPGHSTLFEFVVRNITDMPLAAARVQGHMSTSDAALAGYRFVALTPACAEPELLGTQRSFTFSVSAPIPVGGSVQCSYRIERAADARDDIHFHLCGGSTTFCGYTVAVGTLPQMRIHVEQPFPVPAGSESALVRLRVENLSDWTIPRRDVTTDCREFAGGQSPPHPFLVSTDFEGACETGEATSCINLGGQSSFSYGFALGPFAPGESRSCLLRLDFHGQADSRLRVALFFTELLVVGADGAIGVGGLGPYSGAQELGVAVTPAANSTPLRIPLGGAALVLLALLLLGSASALLHPRE